MTLIFANNTKIEVPASKDVTMYIRKKHPDMLSEWCAYLDQFNSTFREIDRRSKEARRT